MKDWTALAADELIAKTIDALKDNGINALVVENAEKAKKKVFEIIPQNEEVMTMSSVTLETLGIDKEINESGNYDSVKNKLFRMDRTTQGKEIQRIGAAPEYAAGSVHAVTQDGKVIIASNSGSQLPAYAYGSAHVIWVVGTQKIVANLDEGMKRVYDYVLPLESERVKKAYGMERSNVSKLLIINKEIVKDRITLIFVKEKLGF